MGAEASRDSAYEEAAAALDYVSRHSVQHQEKRAALPVAVRLELFTYTEAPGEVMLKGQKSLLKSYEWHMVTAERRKQQFPHGRRSVAKRVNHDLHGLEGESVLAVYVTRQIGSRSEVRPTIRKTKQRACSTDARMVQCTIQH